MKSSEYPFLVIFIYLFFKKNKGRNNRISKRGMQLPKLHLQASIYQHNIAGKDEQLDGAQSNHQPETKNILNIKLLSILREEKDQHHCKSYTQENTFFFFFFPLYLFRCVSPKFQFNEPEAQHPQT